ncbi:hypothetical protein ASG14_06325 [Pedobacter sp. Leaf194]|nr:hypothetical protein ASG14_06325 [Pedobacter sp. Leaf194]
MFSNFSSEKSVTIKNCLSKELVSAYNKNDRSNWQKAVSTSKDNSTYIFLSSNYKLNADTGW